MHLVNSQKSKNQKVNHTELLFLYKTIIINRYFSFVASHKVKSSKSKSINPISNSSQVSSTDTNHDKTSTSKTIDESHTRPTSTSSSSTSSRRSSSNHLNKSSRSSKPKPNTNSSSSSTAAAKISSNNNTAAMLDPLAFAAANIGATGGYTFPYFLPSLLSQAASTNSSSTATGTNNNSSLNSATSYPFSSLSSSLMNPATTFYPFLSPDWFTSPTKFMDTFNNLPSDKTTGNFNQNLI
ncbi:MAG: hypothetical protein IT281_10465 [Ignavibacteria bacterium]|nr:hypothetical protein [Ignavibacteria bacterium]